jgi:transglutaminase-like putative cysteine protease
MVFARQNAVAVTLAVAVTACDWGIAPPQSAAAERTPLFDAMSVNENSIASLGAFVRDHTANPIERLRALHDWVATHITYDSASRTAEDVDPERVFARRKGVCEGYARLLVALGRAADLDVRLVEGDTPYGSHAWNEVSFGGSLMPIDVTWDAGYMDGGAFHRRYSTKYFLADRTEFARDHTVRARPSTPSVANPCPDGTCGASDPCAFRRACEAGVIGACYEVDWLQATGDPNRC